MSEHLDISFHILGDVIDEHICKQIMESVKNIDGIISVIHPNGSNVVEVSARWKESEFDGRIGQIRKIANVKHIKIFKKTRIAIRTIRDHIEISESVVSWKIKSEKAEKVSNIINSAIIKKSSESNIKVRFLIFGPGKDSEEYRTHRLALKNMIENDMHQIASFPEDEKANFGNAVIDEYFMMENYDYTIILLMSIGSISEYSTFFIKENVVHKIRLYVLKKYAKSRSYLNNGPIMLFKKVHKQVYEFSKSEDLLIIVAEMVRDILELKIISRI